MTQISYKNLVKILRDNNCEFMKQEKGSHEKWYSHKTGKKFTVPKTIKASGTYYAILKQAGIK